jgi:hypothetical protein
MTGHAALFPEPARRPPTWTHTGTRAYVYFDIHDAPDIQDGRTTRRRVIRPTHAEILTTGITVTTVWIHGPAVRRNGTLGATQTRTYSTTPDPRQPDPAWLADLLTEHGLPFPRTRATGRYQAQPRPTRKARR